VKSEVTARAAAMGYCSDQLNGVQEARRASLSKSTHAAGRAGEELPRAALSSVPGLCRRAAT
jgi:hypothetical protein